MLDNKITNQACRYEVLLQAIDFFTQRFNLEQISQYAFKFVNEILKPNSSALFIREKEHYVLKQKKLYPVEEYKIPCSKRLKQIPVFHGDIIIEGIPSFFDEEVIEKFNIQMVIPLIIDRFLYGFIVIGGKDLCYFDKDDVAIASTLTKLFANSLGNSHQLEELGKKNKQLDQKIFNLFAINQSAKSLLSQVDLEALYALATDIFSEMTCSRVTSFGVFDGTSQTVKVLGYRNVSNYATVFTELYLTGTHYEKGPVVLDFHKDLKVIQTLFSNWQEFMLLEARYIILLLKDKLLGVVTLSEPMNERVYDEATFELVETLASFTYIAISNALLFKEMAVQNERVKRKFETLNRLNSIIQNINSGVDIEELSELTLKVLAINFGIKKAFLAYRKDKHYEIAYTLGIAPESRELTFNGRWEKLIEGEMILDFREEAVHDFFEEGLADDLGISNGLIIAPICTGQSYDYDIHYPKGVLVVLETLDSLKEEEILLIDTIAKNISPVIYQMERNNRFQQEYEINPLQQFISAVDLKLTERISYDLEFYLFYKIVEASPFQKSEDFFLSEEECYRVNQFIFVLSYEEALEDSSFCRMPYFESILSLEAFDYVGFYKQSMVCVG